MIGVNTAQGVEGTYRLWAPFYDKVFGNVFDPARRAAVAACAAVGGRVLEVGVGTGLSLPLYPASCRVTGVDLSAEMLEVARKRVAADGISCVEDLRIMDVQDLQFPDGAFDVVTAQYVVNTVPDPEAALNEFIRVLRPGGELVIINRIGAANGPRLAVERLLLPITERLGWRSEFPWQRFEAWSAKIGTVRLTERTPVRPFGHFALIRYVKTANAEAAVSVAPYCVAARSVGSAA